MYPLYHLELIFWSENEFGQGHDYEDTIPFKLQMSQLGTTLSSWATAMCLGEKRTPRVLHISQYQYDDDIRLETPVIYVLSSDLNCKLCGRSRHADASCHKFMNHVIGDALVKAHQKETPKILRDHKQFVNIGPCGTPRHDERTDHCPASAIQAITTVTDTGKAHINTTPPAECDIVNAHCETFEKNNQNHACGCTRYYQLWLI
jgi:hypothetical protein